MVAEAPAARPPRGPRHHEQRPARPGELPVELTSFVGRTREIAEVEALLDSTRLLTLTGAGGSGKTRLAVEVASRVAKRYEDGVAWVELAPLTAPGMLPTHVAGALGIREEGERPTIDALADALRDRSMLLVLDNCEHLVDACADLADTLLRECPRLRILATSREALGIGAERAWLVPTLSLPPADVRSRDDALADSEAVRLFVDRARSALATFELGDANAPAVARVCRRLEGLPLAIELAAARVRVLAPEQIAARLDDSFNVLATRARGIPSRHQTLRAAVDWSYRLLADRERVLLHRLAVFAGGFTLDAVEAVGAGDGLQPEEILDLLAALVDKSLVVMHEREDVATYSLLESVRQYALDCLRASGAVDHVRARHAEFYAAWAQAIGPRTYSGGTDPSIFTRIESEYANLRAAAEWLNTRPDRADSTLRLAAALEWFWLNRGRFREGRQWVEAALARADGASVLSRARALTAHALMAFCQGDVSWWGRSSGEAVSLLRPEDRPRELAYALFLHGAAVAISGDVDPGCALIDESIAISRAHDRESLVNALTFRGLIANLRGDVGAARSSWEEAAAVARETRLIYSEIHLTDGLGRVAYTQGDYERARAAFQRVRDITADVDDPWGVALLVSGQAAVAVMNGEFRRAARLLGAVSSIRERIGAPPRPDEKAFQEALAASCRAALSDADFSDAWQEGHALSLARALETARSAASADPAPAPAAAAATTAAAAERVAPVQGPPVARVEQERQGAALRVRALGPLEIRLGRDLVPAGAWSYAKPRELLLYLLTYPDGRTREQVGLALWPDASAAQVRNNFHVTLHNLRKALGGAGWVQVERGRYRVAPDREVDYDAATFEATVVAALRAARARTAPPIDQLRSAIALYRGDFLDGESVGDWHLEIRDRLRHLYVDALDALGAAHLAGGHDTDAADVLQRLTREEPLRESAHRSLMIALARLGDRSAAMEHYRRLVELLRSELGTRPDPQTTALFQRLQRGEPA